MLPRRNKGHQTRPSGKGPVPGLVPGIHVFLRDGVSRGHCRHHLQAQEICVKVRASDDQERSMTAPGTEPDRRHLARLLKVAGSALDPDGVAALIGGILAAPPEIGTSWHALVADP